MLDEDQTDTRSETDDGAVVPGDGRAKTITVVLSVVVLAIVLSIAFFPAFFKPVTNYDDEGSFLLAIRQFMHHGSLYDHTHGTYGPFYFSLSALLFRLTGHDPTLTSGRLIVLSFTGLSSGICAAAVWRVTRSLPFALLVQVGVYIVLIPVAGTEPMHPGSLIVLGLSVLAYAFASYAMKQGTAALVVIGATVGALAMMKINVGLLAAAAVMVAFVVGNSQWPKIVRVLVGAAAVGLPFLITMQRLYQVDTTNLAAIVSVGLLATYASLSADTIAIPRRAVWVIIVSAVGAVAVSSVWPLATGTSPGALFHGVVIQPLGQADHLQRSHVVGFDQLSFVLTALAVYAVFVYRYTDRATRWARSWQLDAAFGVAGLLVFGLGINGGFGGWLPAIALLPALALLSDAPPEIRLVIRLLVPLAILQLLHAYPVAGSQVAWSRVIVCVPCVVTMAAAANRFSSWRLVGPSVRALAVGSIAVTVVAAVGFWPLSQWHQYNDHVALGLPGTRLVRVPPHQFDTLHRLTKVVKRDCDTFYSAPGFDSLYIYTGLPNPTGLLADGPGVLNGKEQRELVGQLEALRAKGQRVCIVRDVDRATRWYESAYGKGPLGVALARYTRRISQIDNYTVSVSNSTGRSPASAG